MARHILAIDLGTSALKVALVSVTGEVVAAEEEAHQAGLLPGGGAEQDPEGWWALITKVSSLLMARGTVPDHCAVQQTAATSSGGTVPRAISREDTFVIRAHQPSGSCSAPPPGSRPAWCASSSAATTSPVTETSATFSAEVPRSIARM